jgi:microcystin-dependent protein
MSAPFIAEIRMFACNFAPSGWALCNGQILPISQNTALFSLLGTTYGGNGTSNFALPNLQGAVPINAGQGPGLTPRDLGESGGQPSVTLLQTEMPSHNHTVLATTTMGTTAASTNNQLALATAGGG